MQPISRLLMLALISATTLIGCNKEESTTDQTKSTAAVTTNVAAKVKKSIQGTFVNSNMGDTHCSISVVDRNKRIDLSAGMNICSDDSIKVGKNYEFIYEEVEVPDCDECQGNQDCYIKCKKTRKEELITSAKLIGGSDAPRVDQKTVVPKTDAATLQSVLQGAAELASVPLSAGSTNQDWNELKKRYPSVKWKSDAMGDGGVVNFDQGFTLEATGARSMILQTTVRLQTGFPDSTRSLLTTLPSVGKTLLTLCDSESMASSYRCLWLSHAGTAVRR